MSEKEDLSDEEIKELVEVSLELRDEEFIIEDEEGKPKAKIHSVTFWERIKTTVRKVGSTAKREKEETIIAVRILTRYVRDKESISPEELKFLKDQSIDLARILPIVAVQAVPAPVPITPFLIAFGKKIGIDVLPREQIRPGSPENKSDTDPNAGPESEPKQ